jgi:hypothetical protein
MKTENIGDTANDMGSFFAGIKKINNRPTPKHKYPNCHQGAENHPCSVQQ